MITINRRATNHNFEKQNLVTQMDRRGQYDLYKCTQCGIEGKGRDLVNVLVSGRYKNKAFTCPAARRVARIRITQCHALGKAFSNLAPESIHEVIAPPSGQNNQRGVWVMGIGEPVKVLFEEYELVE